ncbi:unnamed protein product [Blepharisma stoltei]|uniref:Site-specific DNA endonuclease n=1 Tax=Blepharisma stoltei TaxID=1481888 RepID=A0AAU9JVV3_9CILI|nr:unnamed protein product [Blepharisma stoltei]
MSMENLTRNPTELIKNAQNELKNLEIELQYGYLGRYEQDLITNIDLKNIHFTSSGDLALNSILKSLEDKGYSVSGSMISYYSYEKDIYVFVGRYPLSLESSIPKNDIRSHLIKLKCRYINTADNPAEEAGIDDEDASEKGDQGSRRTKERKIGYIIEKVARWRNLYNGTINAKGETVRLTLEEAAVQVGISKKSLDDYLLQLRFGRKFGFNFEEHKGDKVGLLRAYVKKYKQIQSELAKLGPGDQLSKENLDLLNQKGTLACKSRKCCVPPPGVLKFNYQQGSQIDNEFLKFMNQ